MPFLHDLYMFCAGAGFIYLVGTALMGFAHNDAGHGAEAGHGEGDAGGVDAGGDAGGVDAGGDAGGVDAGGDAGGVDAGGDAGGVDAGGDAGGVDAGGDAGSIDVNIKQAHQGVTRTNLAHARTGSARQRRINLGLLLLKITSPYTIACFSFFFGLTGLIISKYVGILGPLSALPAAACGVIGYNFMTRLMNTVADKLYASSSFKNEDLIGTVGEVTVPIGHGRTGEIIYLKGKTRGTAPAKAKDPQTDLSKCKKVIIADVVDGVFLVEACNDAVLDDSFMIEGQKLRNS